MPSAQHSVSIDRPIDEVFAFFTDPQNEFQWRSQVKDITTEGPAAVGRRVHQVIKGPGGLSVPAHGRAMDGEVQAIEQAKAVLERS